MTARKTTTTRTRRPPAPKQADTEQRPVSHLIGDDFEWQPLQLSSEDEIETEQVPLFYLDDTEYSITTPFPVNLSLQYLRMARERGENIATGWLLEQVLGEDGYTALMNYKALKAEHLRKIGTVVSNLALGAVEDPKDNSVNGSRR